MSPSLLVTLVLACSSLAFWLGRRRALTLATRPAAAAMHSRPGYYGMLTALWCGLPALAIAGIWQLAADPLLTSSAMKGVSSAKGTMSPDQFNLLVNDLRNLVAGNSLAREVDPLLQAAADQYVGLRRISNLALATVVLAMALAAAYWALMRIKPQLRARNQVERVVEIRDIAREPGSRTKITVVSHDDRVDPVGACVGMKGSRVQSIVRELGGERIDIVPWSPDPKILVSRALSPARVLDVMVNELEKKVTVVVSDDQLSLAIGKGGQNVRELQRYTGASVKVPEQSEKVDDDKTKDRDVSVHIIGNFYAVQVGNTSSIFISI